MQLREEGLQRRCGEEPLAQDPRLGPGEIQDRRGLAGRGRTAVQHQVDVFHPDAGILRDQPFLVNLDPDVGIEGGQAFPGCFDLGPPQVRFREEDLPLQVAPFDAVIVHEDDPTDPGMGEMDIPGFVQG